MDPIRFVDACEIKGAQVLIAQLVHGTLALRRSSLTVETSSFESPMCSTRNLVNYTCKLLYEGRSSMSFTRPFLKTKLSSIQLLPVLSYNICLIVLTSKHVIVKLYGSFHPTEISN